MFFTYLDPPLLDLQGVFAPFEGPQAQAPEMQLGLERVGSCHELLCRQRLTLSFAYLPGPLVAPQRVEFTGPLPGSTVNGRSFAMVLQEALTRALLGDEPTHPAALSPSLSDRWASWGR